MALNTIDVAGIISSISEDYTYENKKTGVTEKFYTVVLQVPRFSENCDEIPFCISHKFVVGSKLAVGDKVAFTGSMRTRNYSDENNVHHVEVFGFVEDVFHLEDDEYDEIENKNIVRMEATICRQPKCRQTRSGRIIADLMAVIHRQCHRKSRNGERTIQKSYFFPCIAWGPKAKAADKLNSGDVINLVGRFQSRKYRRKSDGKDGVAYEISILDYEIIHVNDGEQISA